MKFRTEISAQKARYPIGYQKPVMMMGSCFTDNIGAKFKKYLFHVTINPFGVTYNPLSIKKGIDKLLAKEEYLAEDLEYFNELYFSFDHYTKYSDPNKEKALEKINKDFFSAKKAILEAGTLIISFGSAFVYEHLDSGKLVNNCHKIPASDFSRRMLTTKEIIGQYKDIMDSLLSVNPGIKILFTVSPVRHIKDGLIENQRSKSTLLLTIKYMEEMFPESCSYFPSYEIMMDDLRDYRFYGQDMLHPNDQAIEYIWDYFKSSTLEASAIEIIKKLEPLLSAMSHRSIHPESLATKKFREATQIKLEKLKTEFPLLNWSEITGFM